MAAKKTDDVKTINQIVVTAPARRTMGIPITQYSKDSLGLLTQAMSIAKGKRIIAKELGENVQKRIRNLDEEYEEAFYRNEDGKECIPARAILGAMLDAAVVLSIPKTQIKRALRVEGDLYPIEYTRITRDERVVIRKGMSKAPNVACRPHFHNWSVNARISYDPNMISEEAIVNLLNHAGTTTGIGSFRPQCSGAFGVFRVDTDKMNKPSWKKQQKAA